MLRKEIGMTKALSAFAIGTFCLLLIADGLGPISFKYDEDGTSICQQGARCVWIAPFVHTSWIKDRSHECESDGTDDLSVVNDRSE